MITPVAPNKILCQNLTCWLKCECILSLVLVWFVTFEFRNDFDIFLDRFGDEQFRVSLIAETV